MPSCIYGLSLHSKVIMVAFYWVLYTEKLNFAQVYLQKKHGKVFREVNQNNLHQGIFLPVLTALLISLISKLTTDIFPNIPTRDYLIIALLVIFTYHYHNKILFNYVYLC